MITMDKKYALSMVSLILIFVLIVLIASCKKSEPTFEGLTKEENRAVGELINLSENWPPTLTVKTRPGKIEIVKKVDEYRGNIITEFQSKMGD